MLRALLAGAGTATVVGALPATRQPRRRALRFWGLAAAATLATVAIFLLLRSGLASRPPSEIRSLAVLPFANLAGNPDEDFFAEGMTDELITQLTQVGGLRVISRTSVMRFKDSDQALPAIARELNVQAVVEGSVARAAGKVRVRANLIDAASDQGLSGSDLRA